MRGTWHKKGEHPVRAEKSEANPEEPLTESQTENLEARTQGLIAYREGGKAGLDDFLTKRWAEKRRARQEEEAKDGNSTGES